jgi:pSer/pThr/pTyr-binding forkhead associated (FHA) protein
MPTPGPRREGTLAPTETLDVGPSPAAGPARRYLLLVSDTSSQVVPLPDDGELTIGRGAEGGVDIHVNDPAPSRRHARIVVEGGEVRVEDPGSHDGTYVDGVRIGPPVPLARGGVVALGGVSLVLHHDAQPPSGRFVAFGELRRRVAEELSRGARRGSELVLASVRAELGPAGRARRTPALGRTRPGRGRGPGARRRALRRLRRRRRRRPGGARRARSGRSRRSRRGRGRAWQKPGVSSVRCSRRRYRPAG